MNAILQVDDLTKRYPSGVVANDQLTFGVEAGEVVGLLGHNGAGKTTLVRAIAARIRPTLGNVRIAGTDVVANPDAARRLCSLQAQGHVPITGMTPRRAIHLVGQLRGADRATVEKRTVQLADRLDIGDWLDRRSSVGEDTLTGGVLRLVAFCMATVAPTPLIVLDEPTNDVDPVRRRYLWAEIRRLADRGHAVLLVTHNVVEAERSLDRVLLLHHGRLILDGAPARLVSEVDGRLRVDISWEPGTEQQLPEYLSDTVVHERDVSAMVDSTALAPLMEWGNAMRAAGAVEHFSVGSASLDDVYVRAVDDDDRRRGRLAPAVAGLEGVRP